MSSWCLRLLLVWLAVAYGRRLGERPRPHRKLFLAPQDRAIEDRYIVVLKAGNALQKVKQLLLNSGAAFEYEYDTAVKGFAVSGLVTTLLEIVLEDDTIEYIEEVRAAKFSENKSLVFTLSLTTLLFYTTGSNSHGGRL